ncbi:nuclease domain-containing protein [Devosia sp. 1635]|uniref:nuclease domain-containing protein n=1 Tax=Devosia sp. 1635 TaxID=2726066 RepID=UPI001563CAF4|nr:nuclease domain-containing protein [Devosia sp. 1635]
MENFRLEPIRSPKYLDGAKGETCKLRFVGVCRGGTETTVACHVHDVGFGMARKADDIAIIDGCFWCHAFLDHGWVGRISRTVLLEHIIRGLQETLRNRVERGLVPKPAELFKPRRKRSAGPRKTTKDRTAIPIHREWPTGRKLQTRPMNRKSEPVT